MGKRAPEIQHTLNRLHSDIEQQRHTIDSLKSDGHITDDAEKYLGELLASARVMGSPIDQPE
jgi:hypothetical protein